jgi:hypothetical protein
MPPAAASKIPEFRGFFRAGDVNHWVFRAEIRGLAVERRQLHFALGAGLERGETRRRFVALAHDFGHRFSSNYPVPSIAVTPSHRLFAPLPAAPRMAITGALPDVEIGKKGAPDAFNWRHYGAEPNRG